MRVKSLLITYDFPPLVTGIGTFFYNAWKLLDPHAHHILAPRIQGYKKFDNENNLSVSRYIPLVKLRIVRIFLLHFNALSIIMRKKINVLVCGVPLSIGLIGLTFKKIYALPYCIFYYGGEYDKYKKRTVLYALLRKILENADCIITNSAFSSEELTRYALGHKRIYKITPGVDTERFHPDLDCAALRAKHALIGKKVLLTVSRLVKRKGIDMVLQIFPRILHEVPQAMYLVVGSGEEEGPLKEMAQQLGIDSHVIFTGAISNNELPKYYALCDVYVMPNRKTKGEEVVEGFGISFIEAQSAAKPVIGGISGGTVDAVAHGVSGFLVEPDDADELAKTIVGLLKDEGKAYMLGEQGRKRAVNEFTWDVRAKKIETLLEDIITKR